MKLVGAGLLLVVVCVLGGCATYCYQKGKTFDETRHDLVARRAEAMRYSDVGRTQGLGSFEQKSVWREPSIDR